MGTPFMGELRIMSFNFAPKGWAQCNGQLLPINQNQALFSLLGTIYGGDGRVTFGLPDLRGRTPIHVGGGFTQGQRGGSEAVTVGISEMPAHSHSVAGTTTPGDVNTPVGNMLGAGNPATFQVYSTTNVNLTTMQPAAIGNTGGSQAHTNVQPYAVLNICIALQGIFPSQN